MHNHAPDGYRCPFCFLIQGIENEHVRSKRSDIVYQDDYITAFISYHWKANNPGHVLIVPNRHVENLYDLPVDLSNRIHAFEIEVARAFKDVYRCDGVSSRQHNEPAGNQDVWHYHLHVFPRYREDDMYRAKSRVTTAEERKVYADALRAYFQSQKTVDADPKSGESDHLKPVAEQTGIKAILFDLDDTLLHFDDYWKASFLDTFREHPLTSGHDAEQLFACLEQVNVNYQTQYHDGQLSLHEFRNLRLIDTLKRFNLELDMEEAGRFNDQYQQTSKRHMKASPELVSLMTEWGKSYKLGIVTNGSGSWQRDKLEALGVHMLFPQDVVIVSEDAGCEKPSPSIYRQALAAVGAAPEEVLFVGDSWANDVVGPMKAGMRAVWLNKKGETPPASPQPFGIISDLAELDRFVRESNK